MDNSGINLKSSQKLMKSNEKVYDPDGFNRANSGISNERIGNNKGANTFIKGSGMLRKNTVAPVPIVHQKTKGDNSENQLISLFQTNVSLLEIPTFLKMSQIPNSQSHIPKSLTNFVCSDCNSIKGQVRLSCSHLVCVSCYKERLTNFENCPNVSTFKSIRCEVCQLLPNEFELYSFLDQDPNRVRNFMSISILKKCNWCARDLDLMTEYLPESNCLHLCRECYIENLLFKETKCTVCKLPYKNIQYTMIRRAKCFMCNYVGNIVSQAFRSYYGNKLLCNNCHRTIVEDNLWVKIFGDMSEAKGKQVFSYFYNKTCPVCGSRKALSEFTTCEICGNFKCDECFEQNIDCNFCVKTHKLLPPS